MRFAVIGSTGLFGQELTEYLISCGELVEGFHRGNLVFGKAASGLSEQIVGFDAWVNCVGYTHVDEAESSTEQANLVNGVYAGQLAEAAKLAGARFIHISTDYVFDGLSEIPYKTTDSINPQTEYGKSKALGESLIAQSGADYSILRTAWLYGANGQCFPSAIAKLLKQRGRINVVSDQHGQPTWTRDLAEMVAQVLDLGEMPRIVHAVSSGQATWADFAKEVALSVGLSANSIEEISSNEFPTAARRPAWSVLENSSDVLKPISDWRARWREAAPEVLRGI